MRRARMKKRRTRSLKTWILRLQPRRRIRPLLTPPLSTARARRMMAPRPGRRRRSIMLPQLLLPLLLPLPRRRRTRMRRSTSRMCK
jgi:hypothetical protein